MSAAVLPELPSRDAVRAELARRSLAHFFRYSWHVLERKQLVWNWHLQSICDHLQALIEGRIPCRNLNINVPPGSSKSRIVSVCALPWAWIPRPDLPTDLEGRLGPHIRSIFSSRNPRNVMRDAVYCRRLIDSEWYQNWFIRTVEPREQWTWQLDQNAKGLYANTAGGFRQSVASGASVTGDRADWLGMDDMLDATEGESKAARDEFANFYDNAFANRVSDMTSSIRFNISQRLHEADPTGHLLKLGDWESLVIRQEYEAPKEGQPKPTTVIGWSDPRTKDGELMDPVRFPAEELAKEKIRLGSRGYAAQHQQRPAPAEGAILKRAWFRWYKTPRDADGRFLTGPALARALGGTRTLQGVDTALSEKQTADYTADITGVEAPSRLYVVDYLMERMEFPTAKSTIAAKHAQWGAQAVVIEGGSSASGKATVQAIRAESRIPVIELPVMGDKVAGMNAIAPTVEAGIVYIPEDQEWGERLVDRLTRFPTLEYDDDCDGFRILVWYSQYGGGGMGLFEHVRRMAAGQVKKTNGSNGKKEPEKPKPVEPTAGPTSLRSM